ncbi:MAG: hypothetical protein PH343_04710 [Nitrospira sp.]|nr:hypothetical protein [Nitrospira sp.]
MKYNYAILFSLFSIFLLPLTSSAADDLSTPLKPNSGIMTADSSGTLVSSVQPGGKEADQKGQAIPKEDTPFHIGLDVTVASKYIWQGLDYSNGKPVTQPELSVTYKDLSATVWLNYDMDTKEWNEMDIILKYSKELGNVSISGGYSHYNYPHRTGWEPSQDIFIDVSSKSLLNPSLSVHYDFGAGDGLYYSAGIGHDLETILGTLSLASTLHYHDNYYNSSGFPSAELQISDAYTKGSMTITPAISYFVTWDNTDYVGLGNTAVYSMNIAWGF